jgi:hypothetical protein
MKNVTIPKRENKTKRLFIPVTPTEHRQIMDFCAAHNVRLSDFIRYACRETYELLF